MSAKSFIFFVVGAGVGSAVAWFLTKRKYEAMNARDIESMKEQYGNETKKPEKEVVSDEKVKKTTEETIKEVKKCVDILNDAKYTKYSNCNKTDEELEVERNDDIGALREEPYVITPDQFYENEDNDRFSFTLWADGVLTDENCDKVDDVDGVIGTESLKRMGEYEEDILHVRNDRLQCDYEITTDLREFETLKIPKHKKE